MATSLDSTMLKFIELTQFFTNACKWKLHVMSTASASFYASLAMALNVTFEFIENTNFCSYRMHACSSVLILTAGTVGHVFTMIYNLL